MFGKKTVSYIAAISVCSAALFCPISSVRIFGRAEMRSGEGSAIFGTDVEAELLQNVEYDNYLSYYFSHLNYNLADNPTGYCVYVAAAMALSYYDAWWNDDIIAEKYEAEGGLTGNVLSYGDFLSESPGIGFGQGEDLVYDILKGVELGPEGVQSIRGAISASVSFNGNDQLLDCDFYLFNDWIMEEVVRQIDMGYPVIVSMGDAFTQGHTALAFDYGYNDAGEIVLYVHNGYRKNNPYGYSQYIAIDGSVYIRMATVIKPKESTVHKCSDNYVYTDLEGQRTYHCPCECEYHPAHLETHEHKLKNVNGVHTVDCYERDKSGDPSKDKWVRTIAGAHRLEQSGCNENAHSFSCACGYNVSESHCFSYWYIDEQKHEKVCACGYAEETDHDFEYEILNGGWHSVSCPCFGEENEPHYPHYEMRFVNGKYYNVCTACGYIENYWG